MIVIAWQRGVSALGLIFLSLPCTIYRKSDQRTGHEIRVKFQYTHYITIISKPWFSVLMTILSTMQLLMKQKLRTQYLCSIIDDNYAWLGLLELLRYPVSLCLGVDTEFYCRIERCQVSLTNLILLALEYRTFSVFSQCAALFLAFVCE